MKTSLMVLTVIAVSAAAYVGYKYVISDPPGYCRAQDRYIEDDEFIRTAKAVYEWDMSRYMKTYPSGERIRNMETPNGSEAWKYWLSVRDTPKCCYVNREYTYEFMRRIFNNQRVMIALHIGESRGEHQKWIYFDVCGNIKYGDLSKRRGKEGLTTLNYIEYLEAKVIKGASHD